LTETTQQRFVPGIHDVNISIVRRRIDHKKNHTERALRWERANTGEEDRASIPIGKIDGVLKTLRYFNI
jgi:hypothetical protein